MTSCRVFSTSDLMKSFATFAGGMIFIVFICLAPVAVRAADAWSSADVRFVAGDGRVAIVIDGMPVALYCFKDEQVLRPYFAHVRTLDGIQVTRNHPPVAGHDLTDHEAIHPGIWLAFGTVNEFDYWRNLARVRHAEFIELPREGPSAGTFVVRNEYLDPKDESRVVFQDTSRYRVVRGPSGYMILCDVRLSSNKDLTFGDQEEMGLGIRMATPLRVGASGQESAPPGGGAITNSLGEQNEKALWGHAADWCDYTGTIATREVGATIFGHPENFRKARFHARDYGMLVANPFGTKSFGAPEASVMTVRSGDELRLRYGIYIHSGPKGDKLDRSVDYQEYIRLAE